MLRLKNKGLVQPKFEERKQDPNKNKPPAQDLLTDLLDMNFTPAPVQNPSTSTGTNGDFNQFNTAPQPSFKCF